MRVCEWFCVCYVFAVVQSVFFSIISYKDELQRHRNIVQVQTPAQLRKSRVEVKRRQRFTRTQKVSR